MKTKTIAIFLILTILLNLTLVVFAENNGGAVGAVAAYGKKTSLNDLGSVTKQYKTDKAAYQSLKETYVEKKEIYQKKSKELEQLRERVNSVSGGEKDALMVQVEEKAIENILAYIQKTISRMDMLKERGAESEKIDVLTKDLENYLVELENTENLTRERIMEIAAQVRTKARYIHYKGTHVAFKAIVNRLSAYQDKTEKMHEKISEAIGELKEEGKDVSKLETALETLKTDFDKIKDALAKAETEPVTTKLEKVTKAIHSRLKKDVLLVRKIIVYYNGLKKGQEITGDLTVESTDDLEEAMADLGCNCQ